MYRQTDRVHYIASFLELYENCVSVIHFSGVCIMLLKVLFKERDLISANTVVETRKRMHSLVLCCDHSSAKNHLNTDDAFPYSVFFLVLLNWCARAHTHTHTHTHTHNCVIRPELTLCG